MGSDLVVALGRSTVDRRTLFGHNCGRPAQETQWLLRTPGRAFALGEKVRAQYAELPQVRQTFTVLGSQAGGIWGYHQGVNEYGVAVGSTRFETRLRGAWPGLVATDLVRLILERAASARQALDVLANLLARHGQGVPAGEEAAGCGLLVADAGEAFAVETAGRYWVYQEVREVRGLSDVCTIRQDWDRISPGLADHAITQGWWPGDGSKLDFAGSLGLAQTGTDTALRRWGRSTLLLQEQNGRIDVPFVRHLLADHYEDCPDEIDPVSPNADLVPLCQHGYGPTTGQTATSLIADLGGPERGSVAWYAFGPPCAGIYFPLLVDGDLPEPFSSGGFDLAASGVWQRQARLLNCLRSDHERWSVARESLLRLQARFDRDAEEFVGETATLRHAGNAAEVARLAGLFMQHNLEQFEEITAALLHSRNGRALSIPSF